MGKLTNFHLTLIWYKCVAKLRWLKSFKDYFFTVICVPKSNSKRPRLFAFRGFPQGVEGVGA